MKEQSEISAAMFRGAQRVVTDIERSTGVLATVARIAQEEEDALVTLRLDETEVGWTIPGDSEEEEAAALLADGVQYVVEFKSKLPWPPCPKANLHSLTPLLEHGQAVWRCDKHDISIPIGNLSA